MVQTVLITGTSSGFGKLMVSSLLQEGHEVIATMRDVAGRNKHNAAALAEQGAIIVEMDVTDDASVNQAVANALAATGKIDVVVNNAGVGTKGRQESFTVGDFQKLFDVNVFGIQRVSRALIPHFRQRGGGTIVNISSILGRMVIPYYGPYNASKHAVEGLTDSYRVELSQFGIGVHLIQPGGYPTEFFDALLKPSDADRETHYEGIRPTPEEFGGAFAEALAKNPEQKPQDVADALTNLLATPKADRPFRTLVDKMGMGDAVASYNEAHEQLTQGVFGAFGIDHLLKVPS